jgi:predicted nucleic acid-binding protein
LTPTPWYGWQPATPRISTATAHHRSGLDFADALHLAHTDGEPFLTFDKALLRKATVLGLPAQPVG